MYILVRVRPTVVVAAAESSRARARNTVRVFVCDSHAHTAGREERASGRCARRRTQGVIKLGRRRVRERSASSCVLHCYCFSFSPDRPVAVRERRSGGSISDERVFPFPFGPPPVDPYPYRVARLDHAPGGSGRRTRMIPVDFRPVLYLAVSLCPAVVPHTPLPKQGAPSRQQQQQHTTVGRRSTTTAPPPPPPPPAGMFAEIIDLTASEWSRARARVRVCVRCARRVRYFRSCAPPSLWQTCRYLFTCLRTEYTRQTPVLLLGDADSPVENG